MPIPITHGSGNMTDLTPMASFCIIVFAISLGLTLISLCCGLMFCVFDKERLDDLFMKITSTLTLLDVLLLFVIIVCYFSGF